MFRLYTSNIRVIKITNTQKIFFKLSKACCKHEVITSCDNQEIMTSQWISSNLLCIALTQAWKKFRHKMVCWATHSVCYASELHHSKKITCLYFTIDRTQWWWLRLPLWKFHTKFRLWNGYVELEPFHKWNCHMWNDWPHLKFSYVKRVTKYEIVMYEISSHIRNFHM